MRKLHNEWFCNVYSSLNSISVSKSRRIRWVGNATRMGEMRNIHNILVGRPEEKRPLGMTVRRF